MKVRLFKLAKHLYSLTAMNSHNYVIDKLVSGSFHQGDPFKFGISAGLQCAINCAAAICFSAAKQISRWDQDDLDYILETGNDIYCDNGYSRYLALDEIPDACNLRGFVFNLIKVQDMRTVEMKLEDDNASFLGPNFPRLTANCQAVICEQGCI